MPQVDDIKSRLDIVDVISEYIQLKPAGVSFKALCPFHSEKTPSFIVSRERQRWHCFGCGEGGDIFSFVQKIENVDFPEALKILAQKAGVELIKEDPRVLGERNAQYRIAELAAKFWHHLLLSSPQAQSAREYLKKRGIQEETCAEFLLGYAPDSWDTILKFLLQKGFTQNDILLSGLVVRREGSTGLYDRFRNRIIFPIRDAHGGVVGFGGRIMPGSDPKHAKYINSPQTLIYNKSRILFNLDKAKPHIKENDLAVFVEGYMDAIASWQAGIKNIVATSGTALTRDHIKIMRRYSPRMAMAFDADEAGINASLRGIGTLLENDVHLRVITIPEGKDPDECIQKDPKLWSEAVKNSREFMEYIFEITLKRNSAGAPNGKKNIVLKLLPFLSKISSVVERSHWLQKLSNAVDVSEQELREELGRVLSSPREPISSAAQLPEGEKRRDRYAQLEESVLAIGLQFPEHLGYIIDHCPTDFIKNLEFLELYKRMIIYYTKFTEVISVNGFSVEDFFNFLLTEFPENAESLKKSSDMLILWAEREYFDFDSLRLKEELDTIISTLHEKHLKDRLFSIKHKLEDAEKCNDANLIFKLSQEFGETADELNFLNSK